MIIKSFLYALILLIINIFFISCDYNVYRNQFSIFFNRGYKLFKKEEHLGDESINHLLYNQIFSIVKMGKPPITVNLFLTLNHSDINIISPQYLNTLGTIKESSKNDIIQFPKVEELKDINFNIVLKENNVSEKVNISYLGLGLRNYDNKYSFINQLKEKKIILNRRFSILYKENSISDNTQFDGQILFGLLPHEMTMRYNEEDLHWISINNENSNINDLKWQVKFDSVKYNNEEESISIKEVEFDLSLNLIIGPEEYKEKIFKNYFEKFIKEKICKEEIFYNKKDNQFYITYSCKQYYDIEDFPTLSFYSKELNETLTMKYEQLLCMFKDRVFLKVVFKKNAENKKWIFGRAFMEVYPLVFDIDNKKIGYYKIKISESHPVFLFLFFILVISIFCWGLYRGLQNEKKQNIEISKEKKDDDYRGENKKNNNNECKNESQEEKYNKTNNIDEKNKLKNEDNN